MIKRVTRQSWLLRSPHFWVVILMTIGLVGLYYAWPWRNHASCLSSFGLFELKHDMIGILFIIPLTYAILALWWQGALGIWLLALVAMLPRMIQVTRNFGFWLDNMSLFLLPLAAILIAILVLKWRSNERKTLAEREVERRAYMSQVFKCQEEERQQIAQEIHDGSIQTLVAVANRAETLARGGNKNNMHQTKEKATWIRDTILSVSDDLRRLSLHLRPSVLDNMGLASALMWLVDRFNERDLIQAGISIIGVERKLPNETETAIFRIVQEALNNVSRHSRATEATIALQFLPQSIKLTVQDNGVGYSLPTIGSLATEGKFGLIGMEQRAKVLNGTFRTHSRLGRGTSLETKFSC